LIQGFFKNDPISDNLTFEGGFSCNNCAHGKFLTFNVAQSDEEAPVTAPSAGSDAPDSSIVPFTFLPSGKSPNQPTPSAPPAALDTDINVPSIFKPPPV